MADLIDNLARIDDLTDGVSNPVHSHWSYSKWMLQLQRFFPKHDEFNQARAIYSFQTAYENGLTPQQAYNDFNAWTQE